MTPGRALAALLILSGVQVFASAQTPTCPGSGLSITGGRFGDAWSIGIAGPPNAPAILASDPASGPVLTPYGTICLGFSPSVVLAPLTLDATGGWFASGILPLAAPIPAGSTLNVQAGIADPSAPGGITITNGAAVTFRPPRLCIVSGATVTGGPGAFVGVDAQSDTVAVNVAAPAPGGLPVRIPRRGWIGWRTVNGDFYCVDDTTGANVLTIPGVWYFGSPHAMDVSDDGSLLFLTHGASSILQIHSLATGAEHPSPVLPPNSYLNHGVVAIPGTSLAYVGDGGRFHVVDGATGSLVTTIQLPGGLTNNLGGMVRPEVLGTKLHANTFAGLVTIDTTTHTIVAGPTPISTSLFYYLYGVGPGSGGQTRLWFGNYDPITTGYVLVEVSPDTHAILGSYPIPGIPMMVRASGGGTELLLVAAGALHAVTVAPFQITTLLPSVAPSTVAVLGSDTLSKVYANTGGQSTYSVVTATTDPASPSSGVAVPLPPGLNASLYLLSN